MAIVEPQAKKPLCLVNCAKNGDVISTLPIARHFATSGPVPYLHNSLVTPLLLGCSYVERVPLRLSPNDTDKALAIAEKEYERVINLQQFGRHYHGSHDHPHNVRAWISAGLTVENFYDLAGFPLVFDRRDAGREEFLYRTHVKTRKPLLAHFLSCSTSSPFAGHHVVKEALKQTWKNRCELLDLCRIKCPRLYDFIAILERTAVLVTTDGSILHLAAAVPSLPVVVLLGDNPLTAAEPRFRPVLKLHYSQAVRRMREMHGAIAAGLRGWPSPRAISVSAPHAPSVPSGPI